MNMWEKLWIEQEPGPLPTAVENPGGVPTSWLQTGSGLDNVATWGLKQQKENLCVAPGLSVALSFKQINKSLVKR